MAVEVDSCPLTANVNVVWEEVGGGGVYVDDGLCYKEE